MILQQKPDSGVFEACRLSEILCRQIAPLELGDAPLYVVAQSGLPAELGGQSVCNGFTTRSLDLYVQRYVDWRGRGPCMVVNDIAIAEDHEPCDFQHALLAVDNGFEGKFG